MHIKLSEVWAESYSSEVSVCGLVIFLGDQVAS